jgi:hypothetical protein
LEDIDPQSRDETKKDRILNFKDHANLYFCLHCHQTINDAYSSQQHEQSILWEMTEGMILILSITWVNIVVASNIKASICEN